MNPLLKKFSVFSDFQKYEYRDISKPNQSILENLKNFKIIFFNFKYKTTYIKDLKFLKEKSLNVVEKAKTLQIYYKIYKMSEIIIGIYAIHSMYWHYKKGYFKSGSKLAEFYIVGKIIFNVFTFSLISFYILKSLSDPIMYKYFEKKEEEWDQNLKKKDLENKSIKEFRDLKEKMKDKNK